MDRLAMACEEIARHSSRERKVSVLAEYFKSLADDEFTLAVQFLTTGPLAPASTNQTLFEGADSNMLSVGHAVLRQALRLATGWDKETLGACHSAVGDTGETIGLLLRGLTTEHSLSLTQASQIYQQLFQIRSAGGKREALVTAFKTYRPLTLKYFVKLMTRRPRLGLTAQHVEEAIAVSCGLPREVIGKATNRLGDLSQVALAARRDELSAVKTRLFQPVAFMLAKPLERFDDLTSPAQWLVEDKHDGIRSQIHFDGGRVRIYCRQLKDVTASFPEITNAFQKLKGNGSVEGEIVAWRDGRTRGLNVLNERSAGERSAEVIFIAYDLLLSDGEPLLDLSFEQRRRKLEDLLAHEPPPLSFSRQYSITIPGELDRLLREALERGNRGLVLKRRDSLYEAGKRSAGWWKLKPPRATLDVVITSAERGNGSQALSFSGYTLAVRASEGFVNVGKTSADLTASEVKEITRLLRAAAIEKFGKVAVVRPEIVLEVAFDGVQKSPRHKSGYALRSPRIVRWRRDKKPEECDDLGRLEALYQESVQ